MLPLLASRDLQLLPVVAVTPELDIRRERDTALRVELSRDIDHTPSGIAIQHRARTTDDIDPTRIEPMSTFPGSVVPSAVVIGMPSCKSAIPRIPKRDCGRRIASPMPPDTE